MFANWWKISLSWIAHRCRQILQRKLLQIAAKPWNSRKFPTIWYIGCLSFWNSDQKVALFLGLYAFISLFWVQNSHNARVEIKLRTVVLLPYSLTVELLMNNTPLIPGGNLLISKTNLLGELTLLEGYLSHLRSLPSSQPPPSSAFPAAVLCTAAPHQRPWTRKPAVAENWFELLAFYHWATSILVLHRWY